jgi:hypothetical protein
MLVCLTSWVGAFSKRKDFEASYNSPLKTPFGFTGIYGDMIRIDLRGHDLRGHDTHWDL